MSDDYRAAVAAAVALEPDGSDVVVVEADGEEFCLPSAIEKAEAVGAAWVVEVPLVGELLEEVAKDARLSAFYVDAVPGSVFVTTERLVAGKSTLLVAGGAIGAAVPEPLAPPELVEKRVTKILKTEEERFILGIVLVPETRDSQGDIYSAAEVRKAAHNYMAAAGAIGKQHSEILDGQIKILENYVAPVDFEVDSETVAKGTWLIGVRVIDDDLWQAAKDGSFTGFSIGGSAVRKPEQVD